MESISFNLWLIVSSGALVVRSTLLETLHAVASSLVMPPVWVDLTEPSRCRRCVGMPMSFGLRAPDGPSWRQTNKSPIVAPFFTFLWWNQWLRWAETGSLMDKLVRARQENYWRTSHLHSHDETTQHAIEMSVPPGYKSVLYQSAEQENNDSASDASQPFELAIIGSPASTIRPIKVGTTCDNHFLFAFFSFSLAKPGIAQPQRLTGMQEKCWPSHFFAFCVISHIWRQCCCTGQMKVVVQLSRAGCLDSEQSLCLTRLRCGRLCSLHKMMSGQIVQARSFDA